MSTSTLSPTRTIYHRLPSTSVSENARWGLTPGELCTISSSRSLKIGSSSEPIKANDIEAMKIKENVNAITTRTAGPKGMTPARVTTLRVIDSVLYVSFLVFLGFVLSGVACRNEYVLAEDEALRRPVVDKKE